VYNLIFNYTQGFFMSRLNQNLPCTVCGEPSIAKNLCGKHYSLWRKHGHTESTRPLDWGSKSNHPLYYSWGATLKVPEGRCDRWNNFWNFVSDIGERPTEQHRLKRKDISKQFSPENCYWQLSVGSSECKKTYQREWRKRNPEKNKNNSLRKNHGISITEYDKMFQEQNGKCAICKKEETTVIKNKVVRLAVDHCHSGGGIRGLLCRSCNQAIGMFNDDVSIIKNSIDYLNNNHAKPVQEEEIDIPPLVALTLAPINEIIHEIEYPDEPIPSSPKKEKQPIRLCSVDGCGRTHAGHGFCRKHMRQANEGYDPHEQFLKKCEQCGESMLHIRKRDAIFCSPACSSKYYRIEKKELTPDKPECSYEGCSSISHLEGLCLKHYMTGNKNWQGRNHTQESIDKMSLPIQETTQNIFFTSLTNALEYYDFPMPTLTRALKKGKPIVKGEKRGLQFIYIDRDLLAQQENVNPNLKGERYVGIPVPHYDHCIADGCERKVAGNGLCLMHYKRAKRGKL